MEKVTDLKEAINVFLKRHGLTSGIEKVMLEKIWFKLNKTVADQTTDFAYYHGTLFITIKSAVLKHELMIQKTKLIERLNHEMGKTVVKDIRIK